MLVDTTLTASRWRTYAYGMSGCVVLLLIGCSGLHWGLKAVALILFVMLFAVDLWRDSMQARLTQLWQGSASHWYWRMSDRAKVHQGQLLSIRAYGVLMYLVFTAGERRQTLVLWRDQVSAQQWRYLTVLQRLK